MKHVVDVGSLLRLGIVADHACCIRTGCIGIHENGRLSREFKFEVDVLGDA